MGGTAGRQTASSPGARLSQRRLPPPLEMGRQGDVGPGAPHALHGSDARRQVLQGPGVATAHLHRQASPVTACTSSTSGSSCTCRNAPLAPQPPVSTWTKASRGPPIAAPSSRAAVPRMAPRRRSRLTRSCTAGGERAMRRSSPAQDSVASSVGGPNSARSLASRAAAEPASCPRSRRHPVVVADLRSLHPGPRLMVCGTRRRMCPMAG